MNNRVSSFEHTSAKLGELGIEVPNKVRRAGARPPAREPTAADPTQHHFISQNQSAGVHLGSWVGKHAQDPAFKVSSTHFLELSLLLSHAVRQSFIQQLKDHCLARLLKKPYYDDATTFTDHERQQVHFQYDRIYLHSRARFNFTTYDLRRDHDSVSAFAHSAKKMKCNIMLLANEDSTPSYRSANWFWYARVLYIFHANVYHPTLSPMPQPMDFLRVRWFGLDLECEAGWKERRLDRVGFVPENDPNQDAFGFVDPSQVLRGCHLIPAFADGRTTGLLQNSVARDDVDQGDWQFYYVNRSAAISS
jgi:hypothetical protein